MNEINIDISNQYAKSITENKLKTFDIIITLCGDAKDQCLNLSNIQNQHIHWNISDPAKVQGLNETIMDEFRKTRDRIMNEIECLITDLKISLKS